MNSINVSAIITISLLAVVAVIMAALWGWDCGRRSGFQEGLKKGEDNGKKQGKKDGHKDGQAAAQKIIAQRLESTTLHYVQELERLIINAPYQDLALAKTNARSVLIVRDSLRVSLETFAKSFNSEIDRLAIEIADANTTEQDIMNTLETLSRVWPTRRQQYMIEGQKLLVEFGILDNVGKTAQRIIDLPAPQP